MPTNTFTIQYSFVSSSQASETKMNKVYILERRVLIYHYS